MSPVVKCASVHWAIISDALSLSSDKLCWYSVAFMSVRIGSRCKLVNMAIGIMGAIRDARVMAWHPTYPGRFLVTCPDRRSTLKDKLVPPVINRLLDFADLYKTKNLVTLTVDGKSKLHIMKKGKKTDTNTKDPLYLVVYRKVSQRMAIIKRLYTKQLLLPLQAKGHPHALCKTWHRSQQGKEENPVGETHTQDDAHGGAMRHPNSKSETKRYYSYLLRGG
uniref:Uncharacterized protein n=1 Tax=Parascaris univalens TaxID=6257 RepID=A0A915C0K4_PARUN